MPNLRRFARLLSSRRTSNNPNTDTDVSANLSTQNGIAAGREFEGTHYHTLLPPSAERYTPTRDSEGPWRPPTPDRVMTTRDGASHLHTFQQLPGEYQVRVIWLHQTEGMTVEQAVATAAVELRLRLLDHPVAAREAHTAAVRLTMEQVNDNLFTQWILLSVLVQTLPQYQQATGQRVLRLVSADPRDSKGLYHARREAAQLGNGFINQALDRINDNAASFHRNNEDLRGLHQYDRHRPSPSPEPIEGPPEDMITPEDVLKTEKILMSSTEDMECAIARYSNIIDEWLEGLSQNFASEDDPVLAKLARFALSWARYVHTPSENRQREVLHYPFDRSSWDDPSTSDPGSILLGAFFKCAPVRRGHPRPYHLNVLANWDDWTMRKPAVAVTSAADDLRSMAKAALAHLEGLRVALCRELAGLRPIATHGLINGLVSSLRDHEIDAAHIDMLRCLNAAEIDSWPLVIRCRLYTVTMLSRTVNRLGFLCQSSRELAQSLDQLDPFLTMTDDKSEAMFKIYGRARRHAFAAWNEGMFSAYHYDAVCQFREMLDSCQNLRAKTLTLAQIPESGCGADFQRVRDIAVAANLAKSISESAEMLLWQQKDLQQLSEHIRSVDQRSRAYLSRLTMKETEGILAGEAENYSYEPRLIRQYVTSKIPSSAAHLDCLGRSDFGPSLRDAVADAIDEETYGAVDLARAYYTASLQRPLQSTVAMIRDHRLGVVNEGLSFAFTDVALVSHLLLRAVYFSYVDTPPSAVSQAQGLSRHCWILGLLGAWLEWHTDVSCLIGEVLEALDKHDKKYPRRSQMWRLSEVSVAEALNAKVKDWDKIEAALAGDEKDVVPVDTKDQFFEHLHKLRLLRVATKTYMDLPDLIDIRVLPEDFQHSAMSCGIRNDENFDMLHRIIKFNGSVVDGGSVTVDATGWEGAHEYQLREMGLEHLSCSRRDSVLM